MAYSASASLPWKRDMGPQTCGLFEQEATNTLVPVVLSAGKIIVNCDFYWETERNNRQPLRTSIL